MTGELEKKISELMKDGEIQSKTGIYWYAIDGDEQHLNLRMFDDKVKTEVWETWKQGRQSLRSRRWDTTLLLLVF